MNIPASRSRTAVLLRRVEDGGLHGPVAEEARELRACLGLLLTENEDTPFYEGSGGASPRIMKEVMLNALQSPDHEGLSPLAVFDELRQLVGMKSVYAFLQQEALDGYHDNEAFIDVTFERWLSRVDDELRSAVGLVSEQQYSELFSRYILHVNYALKGERVYNENTRKNEDPDKRLMKELEGIWEITEDADSFRKDLLARVGAWRVDYPDQEISYQRLFPELFDALEDDYYQKQRATLRKVTTNILQLMDEETDDADAPRSALQLSKQDKQTATSAIEEMTTRFAYPSWALREALGALLAHRY